MLDLPLNPLEALEDLAGLTGGDGNDDVFELAIGPFVNGQLRVMEFEGSEAMNDLYSYEVTFTSQLPLAGLYALAGEPGCLTIKATDDNEPRVIQGIVAALEALGAAPGQRGGGQRRYRATLVPKLWLLTQRRTIRHFQQQTPKEILEQILDDIKVSPKECKWHLREKDYPKLPFVYQREETDYEFFCRVASDAGIVWCFEHASGLLDSMIPGAGAIAGALGSVADMIGGPVASAVEEAGAVTKMLTVLTFSDDARHLPAVQNMALANELLGSALQSGIAALATEIGGKALGDAAGGLIENPADEIPYDDEASAGTDAERVFDFGLKKTMRPKRLRAIESNAQSGNWAGVAKKDPVDLSPGLGLGLAIGPKGPSLRGCASLDLDVDAPTVPPSMLMQQLYQLDPNLRFYGDKEQRLNLELDRARVERIQGTGHSDCRRLGAGYRFRLAGHPNGDLDREYTVVGLVSRGVTDPSSNEQRVYQNEFRCIPSSVLPLPTRSGRPRLTPELARVVAVRGTRVTSNLDTNPCGYVHIRFAWDVINDEGLPHCDLAYGAPYDHAVWVPVSQPWGGDGYGMQVLPREGMEVIIDYLEGHGERPYVKGCVYSERNHLPFVGKGAHQKIGFASRSIPEDGGHSEISIDDRRGAELIHVRSEHDLQVHVLNESRTEIGRNAIAHVAGPVNVVIDGALTTQIGEDERRVVVGGRTDHVGGGLTTRAGSSSLTVEGDVSELIEGGHNATVLGDSILTIDRSRTTGIGDSDVTTIGRRESITVGLGEEQAESDKYVHGKCRVASKDLVLEGTDSITIRCRDTVLRFTPQSLTLLASAIFAQSKEIELNSEGTSVRLDQSSQIFSKDIVLQTAGANLMLGDIAQLTGKSVKLGDGRGASLSAKNANESNVKKQPLVCLNEDAQPFVNCKYRLEVGGKFTEGTTDADGRIMVPVPDDVTAGRCTLWTGEFPAGPRIVYDLAFGSIEHASSILGAQKRLRNLGRYFGQLTGEMNRRTLDALLLFQRHHDLEVTGEFDEPTVARLMKVTSL